LNKIGDQVSIRVKPARVKTSTMERKFFAAIFLGVIFSFAIYAPLPEAQAQQALISAGDLFPETPLPTPSDSKDRAYLGIPEGRTFLLKEVKGEAVLVEILNVYCGHCQDQTGYYNKLFDLVGKDPHTKGRIKIMGFAAGNDETEVKEFRETFKVPYPIIPDPLFAVTQSLGVTRAPFSIYVRQDPSGKTGVVAATHRGVNSEYRQAFDDLRGLTRKSLEALRKEMRPKEEKAQAVKPVLSPEELQARLRAAFTAAGGGVAVMEKVELKSSREVYVAEFGKQGPFQRLFAEVVSRSVPCDSCHDVHFIYLFDKTGKIIQFEPIQLSKYENEPWDERDVARMRARLQGKYLFDPFVFDSKVDAVSSATISSAVIFNSFADGQALYRELKEKGLI
jgi:thiol-disulfide isomerase/thioredoxin